MVRGQAIRSADTRNAVVVGAVLVLLVRSSAVQSFRIGITINLASLKNHTQQTEETAAKVVGYNVCMLFS